MRLQRETIGWRTMAVWLLSLAAAATEAQDTPPTGSGPESGPESEPRVTPTIRAHVYDAIAEVRTCLEAGDPGCALEAIADIAGDRNLNAFERANLHDLEAIAHFDLGDFDAAAAAYEAILALPHEELTDGLIEAAMKNLASTYWNLERPRDALAMLDEWMALPTTEPAAADWYLKGTMHYQIDEYTTAAEAAREAIRLAEDRGELGEEAWYQLLAAAYASLEETELTIETLTTLVTHWTKREHVLRLAGQLSLVGRERDTLTLFEIAYGMGWLTSSNNLVSLANMYLRAETPYKAATVLEQGLDDGNIESNERTWSLLAQAWQQAAEHEKAIPAFRKAADLATDGKAGARLAESLAARYRWEECTEAAQSSLERGGLTNPDLVLIQLGYCHVNLRQWDEADDAFERAARYEQSRDIANQWLAHVLGRRNTERDNEERLRQAEEYTNESVLPEDFPRLREDEAGSADSGPDRSDSASAPAN